MTAWRGYAWTLALAIGATSAFAADQIVLQTKSPGVKVSPLLYGIFFEEINRAGDGGIYAEMIQNRSFEDAKTPIAWKGVRADLALDASKPLNANNPTSLRVTCREEGYVANGGFARDWQERNDPGRIAVEARKLYELSLYARADEKTTLVVSLLGVNGKVLATQEIANVGAGWTKYNVSLAPSESDHFARLAVGSKKPGTFYLDQVSLFPKETWKNRKNGLRKDLMEKLEAMHPAFVRFPGGCFVEGIGIENRVQWKQTIGDVAERPGHMNRNWGYFSSDGLGQHEYLQMCEDLGAEPLFVINCGMAHPLRGGPLYAVPMGEMDPYIQDALDAIEYANGPTLSKWGALRAKNGHPAPFNLKMIEIGNEESGPDYAERFAVMYDAIKAKYPEMQLIANEPVSTRTPDLVDPHHYGDFQSFLNQVSRFDKYDRKAPKVYFGEYAQTADAGRGTLQAAIGEAAFMTGLERNGDIVAMSSYAPLLCNVDWRAWNPNAIVFDQGSSYGTPSYWVQAMFAANRCDETIPTKLTIAPGAPAPLKGKIGVGTWGGSAEFKDVKVVQGDKTLFESDFSKGTEGWELARGHWTVQEGALRQISDENGTLALAGDANWGDYTLTLKARKISGPEGFLITFAARDAGGKSWWNVGGWGNGQHGIEHEGIDARPIRGSVETDRWYGIKIEIKGATVKCYLDGEVFADATRQATFSFACVAGKDAKTGETILKVVNAGGEARTIDVNLSGAASAPLNGRAWVLTSASERDENSFDEPKKIVPVEEPFKASGSTFQRAFPAYSVTILRWKQP